MLLNLLLRESSRSNEGPLIFNLKGFLGVKGKDKDFACGEAAFLVVAFMSQFGNDELSSCPHIPQSRSEKNELCH